MTLLYKIMGPHLRPIGDHLADGETVHPSALDRMNLATCAYSPKNLKAYLAKVGPPPSAKAAAPSD